MRNYLKYAVVLTLVAAVLALGGISCGEEEAKEAYKIGAVVALNGPASNLGIPEKQTLEMMAEQINEDGGINGHPLEVIIYDTETNVEKCVSMATRLIEQDNVLAIIGPSSSGESESIIDTVTTAKIPNVSLASRLSVVTPVEQRYWVFKTPQTEVEAVRAIYAYLESKGVTQVAIITDTSSFGQGGRKYLESDAGAYGITILDKPTFTSGDTDMTSQLTHIKGTAAKAVICWGTDKESAIVAQNMKTLQMTIPLFCSHGVANRAFIKAGGASVEGVIIPAGKLLAADEIAASDPQQEVLVNYRNDYEAIYGAGSIDTFGGHAYDALSMVIAALENMQEGLTTTEARAFIRDYIENDIKDLALTGGVFTMSPTNHLGMSPGSLLMYEIKDGDWSWLK